MSHTRNLRIILRGIVYFPFFILKTICTYFRFLVNITVRVATLLLTIAGIYQFLRFQNPILLVCAFLVGVVVPLLLRYLLQIGNHVEQNFYAAIYMRSPARSRNHKTKTSEKQEKKTTPPPDKSLHSQELQWFRGISDAEGLEKRHRELVKIYHPDNQNGDTSAIAEINCEYQQLKKKYG